MTTDFRALCARLANELDANCKMLLNDCDVTHQLADQARAALAEPEPKGPTVMEIIELAEEVEAAELGQVDLVRTALARWGQHS